MHDADRSFTVLYDTLTLNVTKTHEIQVMIKKDKKQNKELKHLDSLGIWVRVNCYLKEEKQDAKSRHE